MTPEIEGELYMDFLDRMLGHDRWATRTLLDLSSNLTDEQLDQEFDIGHRNLRETFDHMIYVIDLWTGWMTGRPVPHDRSSQEYDRSIASLIERHERFHDAFDDLARDIRDRERYDETFRDHFNVPQSLGSTIVQVMHHNGQHRSEIRHMLVRLGLEDLWDYDTQEWEHMTGRISRHQPVTGE